MSRLIVPLAALTAAASLAAPMVGAAAGSVPTRAATAHWRAMVLRPANLNTFWRGYASSPLTRLTKCHVASTSAGPFYSCSISVYGTLLGYAGLVRVSGCSYSYLLYQVGGSNRMTRNFRFCG